MDTGQTPTEEQKAAEQQMVLQQFKSGVNWFYWIAGLSILNSLIFTLGGDLYFVVGLGVNYLLTGIIYGMTGVDFTLLPTGIKILTLLLCVIASSVFFLFGYLANKKSAWAFITGMILYTLDGLIFLMIGDYLSIAFHAMALLFIFKGYSASQKLKRIEFEAGMAQAGLPPPIK
jgi:hypothetical protein